MSERGRRTPWLLLALGGSLLFVLLSFPLFVLPSVDAPEEIRDAPVDAVAVLGGGQGERIATAHAVLPRLPVPAPDLLLSVPYEAPLLTCGDAPGLSQVTVRCLVPEPMTTSGEALSIATMAAEEGWSRIVVVTSDYHITRARILVSRCVERLAPDLEVLWVAGDTAAASVRGLWAMATEWPSLLGTPWDHQPACTGDPAF